MSAPADPGLQPERTALAWRRTSLALIGLSLGSARVTWPVIGAWGLALAGAGSALGVWLVLRGGPRYARHSTAVASGEGAGDGLAPLLASLLTMAIAVAGIVSVVVGHH